jgi:hypothetical protein
LRAVYPLPAAMAVEPDTGHASNDECFAPMAVMSAHPPLNVVGAKPLAAALATSPQHEHDDYYLGGYAGI